MQKNRLVKYLKTENFSVSIEHQSSQVDSNQNFNRNFDWSMENSNFWKTKQFYAKTPQSTIFHEWNAWVWDAMLFKNTWIEPSFPKIKIFNQFSLNSQTLNMFCIGFKEISNLVGQTKITNNNIYNV